MSSLTPTPTPLRSSTPPSLHRLKALLRFPLRVTIDDGRIFLGTFVGTDKQLNILLVSTEEFRIGPDALDGNPDGRFVGQVMIPWRLVRRVESPAAREGAQIPTVDVAGGTQEDEDDSLYS
ncbi:hypothetical protein C8Q72DRAFT_546367 [Fomitopsis betulina]|nr:hypothetical protein C8Q72DRAFT_546367 [Fomitopsis betulina]